MPEQTNKKNNMKTKNNLKVLGLVTLLAFTSCQKESGKPKNEEENPIQFNVQNNTGQSDGSSSEFTKGNTAVLHGYYSGDYSRYISKFFPSTGVYNPPTLDFGNKLVLPNGTYDFFFLSTNNNNMPDIKINDGISDKLENSTDYLLSSNKGIIIKKNSNIDVLFKRLCSKISIGVLGNIGQRIENIDLTSVEFKYPDASTADKGVLSLENGQIVPLNSFSSKYTKNNNINENTWSDIVLPTKCDGKNTLEFILTVNYSIDGEIFSGKKYSVKIDLKEVGIEAGKEYRIACIIGSNEISFPEVRIEEWESVKINGNTLEEL